MHDFALIILKLEFLVLTDAGLEKKVRHRTVCPTEDISLRASLFTVESPLLILQQKFERENSHVPQSDTQSFIG